MARNAIAVCEQHHAALLRLVRRVQSAPGAVEQRVVFSDFSKTLTGHLAGVETILIPALIAAGKELDAAELAHGVQACRAALAAAIAAQDTEAFREAVALVSQRLKERISEERTRLFALLAKFSIGEQELLAADLELEVARYVTRVSRADLGGEEDEGSDR